MNTAQNLEDELQDQKETEPAEAHQHSRASCDHQGWTKAGVSVPGAPSTGPTPGPRRLRPSKVAPGNFAPVSNPRLPGRGARPRHLLDAEAARPRPLPGPRPPPGVAQSASARTAGRSPGGFASPLPGVLSCSWPCPRARTPGPPRGASTVPPGAPPEARPRGQRLSSRDRLSGRPHSPCPDAGRQPRPCPAKLCPSGPLPGARPWTGGPTLRTRGGARPLAHGPLTHRSLSLSPQAAPAVRSAYCSLPRPGARSSGPGPGTRGTSARRARRVPARRARSAGPRTRAPERREGRGRAGCAPGGAPGYRACVVPVPS